MSFDPESVVPPGAKIKVIGIGGGGGNVVNTMIRQEVEGVDFIAANTDVQALRFSLAPVKIQVGRELTKGLGAGADPDIGRDAALEDRHAIQEALAGADMIFITAGMGGGTGTGGASVIAQIARDMGALTVGVVTKPFYFEGKRRRRQAEIGVQRLRESVDTLITIPNQRLLQVASPELSMIDAFRLADNVLLNAVRGISDIINVPGTVNVDFADVKTVMSSMGLALMGIGTSAGEQRALDAARQAISSPLLEDVDIEGATGILINITAGSSVTLMEINEACSIIQDAAHEDANIIFGAVIDENIGDEIRVTVIATGFPSDAEEIEGMADELGRAARSQGFDRSKNSYQRASSSPKGLGRSPFSTPQNPSQSGTTKPVEPKKEVNAFSQAAAPKVWEKEPSLEPEPRQQSVEPVISAVSEAEDLARWTMGEVKFDQDSHKAQSLTSDRSGEPTISLDDDALSLEPQPEVTKHEQSRIVGAMASETIKELTEESSKKDAAKKLDLAEDEDEWQDANAEQEPPLETLFSEIDQEPMVAEKDSFDQKIDEALELTERLKTESNRDKKSEQDQDDLDVPAFLRNGMKDLSLS